jgi:hypothetical protein
LLGLIQATDELAEEMNEFSSGMTYFDIIETAKKGIDFKLDRLEQSFERKQNDESYSVEDTAEYFDSKFGYITEDIKLLQQE